MLETHAIAMLWCHRAVMRRCTRIAHLLEQRSFPRAF
jgi:hypothetical protein